MTEQPPTQPTPAARPQPQQPLDYARPLFVENQRFTQWWFWVVLIVPAVLVGGAVLLLVSRGRIGVSTGRGVLLALAVPMVLPFALYLMRMATTLTAARLTVRFFPVRRHVDVADITSFRAITYSWLDFGGWGIKWAGDGSLVLNVRGDRAIRINRRSGKSLIVGTQRPDEFAAALEQAGVRREICRSDDLEI